MIIRITEHFKEFNDLYLYLLSCDTVYKASGKDYIIDYSLIEIDWEIKWKTTITIENGNRSKTQEEGRLS